MDMESLNGYLTTLANQFYISHGSREAQSIDNSVAALKTKLKSYLGSDLKTVIEFGSYRRDTILPRTYDDHSDVDLMVVFNHSQINVTPNTYRGYLKNFCDHHYFELEHVPIKPNSDARTGKYQI